MENNAPTTPSIVSGQNSLAFEPEPKLTDELIKAGWTVNLSQRLSKWYFYNKFTQQSLWEMPSLQVNIVFIIIAENSYFEYFRYQHP